MTNRNVEQKNGYIAITPDDLGKCVPLTCPICDLAMSTHDNLTSYMLWTCCAWCEQMWVQGKREKWSNGWRPEKHIVEMVLKSRGMI